MVICSDVTARPMVRDAGSLNGPFTPGPGYGPFTRAGMS